MPRTRECDYCGADIEPGTGTMLIHNNGSTTHFCSSKCENNADLGREARNLDWTDSERGSEESDATEDEDTETETVEADAAADDTEDSAAEEEVSEESDADEADEAEEAQA